VPNAERGPVARIGTLLLALIATGIAAEATLVPIALDNFGCNGAYGILANVVAIPLSSFEIMPAMILALLLEPVGLADSCYTVLRLSLDLLITVSLEVQRWPGAVIRAPLFPTGATPLFILGGLWLLLWRTRMRWFGLAPLGAAAAMMIAAAPADLLVSEDGRHAAVRIGDGQLAMLRPRAESFVGDMWSDATASSATVPLADRAATCSRDLCIGRIERGGRSWIILATRSRSFVDRPLMQRLCRGADIVVSDRRLPSWCRPRWLRLDRATLALSGAIALWLDPPRMRTVAEAAGDHPWARRTALPVHRYTERRPGRPGAAR
jgi:competence protein ComEC